MKGPCPQCGNDSGFDWAYCSGCGADAVEPVTSQPQPRSSTDRWERTVIEHEALPSREERARFSSARGDFYRPIGAGGGNSAGGRLRFDDEDDDNEHTILDRGADRISENADDHTQIIRGGRKGISGPLVYLVQRNGIRAGKVHLLGEETSIGRAVDNDVVVGDDTVSKHHAKVRLEDGKFFLWDLASVNHSYLLLDDGTRKRILEPHALADGDTVDLGEARLTYIEVDRVAAGDDWYLLKKVSLRYKMLAAWLPPRRSSWKQKSANSWKAGFARRQRSSAWPSVHG